jgi:hypothetical protein
VYAVPHRLPPGDDDPTVVHEATQQLATINVPVPDGDGTPSTPAGTTGEGVQADPPREASADLTIPRDGASDPGSGRSPTKRQRLRKIRDLFGSPAEQAEVAQPAKVEAEPAAYSAAQEEIETDARRYLDAQHERIYAAFVLLVTYLRIVEARGMLDRYVRNTHAADPASVASWLLVRLGNDGDGAP